MNTLLTFAASSEPAKGAPIGDVIWGTAAATAATALVIWVAMAHRDPARLAALKIRLAANRLFSPLYDTDGFRRAIETAYLRMVEIAREGRAPENFAVPG